MFNVGDRVIVKDDYREDFAQGQIATIVYDDGTTHANFLIEFDKQFEKCHGGDGQCRAKHGWWIGAEWLQPVYDRTTERKQLGIYKKENDDMELLEIYFENKQLENDAEFEKACERARKKDLIYKELIEIQEKYKDVKGVMISIHTNCYEFNETIEKEILKAMYKRDNRDKELHNLRDEISAQLKLCETYEQKQHILKVYNIINEQGKLNK